MKKIIGRRAFAFAFGISFMLFSTMAALAIFVVNPPVQGYKAPNPSSEASRYLPEKNEALTLLCVISQDEKSPPHTFVLLGFEPFRGNMPVHVIRPETIIRQNGETIAQVFEGGGIADAQTAMSEFLGIGIERFATATNSELVKLFDSWGPVEYSLPEDISFSEMGRVQLAKGVHKLAGQEAVAAMLYPYKGGRDVATAVSEGIISEMINEHIMATNSMETDEFFRKITAFGKTDITYNDIAQRMQALRFLARLKREIAYPILLTQPLIAQGGEVYYNAISTQDIASRFHKSSELS